MPGIRVVILRFGAPAGSSGLQVAFKLATFNMLPAELSEILSKTKPKVVLSSRRKNSDSRKLKDRFSNNKNQQNQNSAKSKSSNEKSSKLKTKPKINTIFPSKNTPFLSDTPFPAKTSAAMTHARYSEIGIWQTPQFSGGELGESQLTLGTASGIEGPESSIEIQFKSIDSEGVILYASTRRNDIQDFLLIGVKEGCVVVWFDMGQGVQRVSSGFKVVGDQWHVLAFHRTQ